MPKQTRKSLQEQVSNIVSLFEGLIGATVQIRFGDHSFITKLEQVKLGSITAMSNKPDERLDAEGKTYRPGCVLLRCEDGNLYLIVEDIVRSVRRLGGVLIEIGPTILEVSRA